MGKVFKAFTIHAVRAEMPNDLLEGTAQSFQIDAHFIRPLLFI
jgi:hypothetical protein